MASKNKAKPFKLPKASIASGGLVLVGEQPNGLPMDKLPLFWDFGHGCVPLIELYVQATIGIAAGSAAAPGYYAYSLLDTEVRVGEGEGVLLSSRKGWQHPLREYLHYGQFIGQQPDDIPANGTGAETTVVRTFTIRVPFTDWKMGLGSLHRLLPVAAFRLGRLVLTPHTTGMVFHPAAGGTATLRLTDVTVTPYVHIKDFPLQALPLGSFVQEGFAVNQRLPKPGPGAGQYMRCTVTQDPQFGAVYDNVTELTKLRFGKSGPGGYPIYDRDVVELMRAWNDENAMDPKPWSNAAAGTVSVQEFYRFLDTILPAAYAGHSTRLHGVPLIWPHQGDRLTDMPDFKTAAPELTINDDNDAGLQDSYTFLYDRYLDRDDATVTSIMNAIAPNGRAKLAKARPMVGGPNPARVPLFLNMT